MIEYIKTYYTEILIIVFAFICVVNCTLVLWEVFTSESIVDKIWRVYESRKCRETEESISINISGPREDGEPRATTDDADSG